MLIETFRNSCLVDQAEDKIMMILSLLLTLTAYAATATTSCVSYGSSLGLSLPLLLLLLSTPLSHLGLITAPHSTLVSLLCVIRTAARLIGGIPRTGHV